MSDLNTCDCCGKEEPSIDLFWNVHWEEHTLRQLSVLGKMQDEGYEAVCSDCFYELLEEDLYA
jgi:hypothetical protein